MTRVPDKPPVEEAETWRRLMRSLRVVRFIARPVLGLLGKRTDKLDEIITTGDKAVREMNDILTMSQRFNDHFLPRGWMMYERIDVNVAKACVEKATAGDVEGAEQDLVAFYDPDRVRLQLMWMRGVDAFAPRMDLAERALRDYAEGRYYASTLVTLTLIDGLVNEVHPRRLGFFTRDVDLTAWASLSTHDGTLGRLAKVMQKPRQKRTTDPLTIPFRHGIVHGMDLSFDSRIVAAKAWAALFAVSDWAVRAEAKTLGKPATSTQKPLLRALREHAEFQREMEAHRKLLDAWVPRTVVVGADVPRTGQPTDYVSDTPERAAVEFLANLARGNFGMMGETLTLVHRKGLTPKALAGDLRKRYEATHVHDFELTRLSDLGPGVTEVEAIVRGEYGGDSFVEEVRLRVNYELDDGEVRSRGTPGGRWKLVFWPALPSD